MLFSDGLTEAGVEAGRMLGLGGLVTVLESANAVASLELLAMVFDRVGLLAAATDDRSLMVIELPTHDRT